MSSNLNFPSPAPVNGGGECISQIFKAKGLLQHKQVLEIQIQSWELIHISGLAHVQHLFGEYTDLSSLRKIILAVGSIFFH